MIKFRKNTAILIITSLILSVIAYGNQTTVVTAKKTPAKVQSIAFKNVKKRLKLQKGKKYQLRPLVKVTPNKKKYCTVTYTSSNKQVVSVTKKGLLKGVKKGTAIIRAISKINPKKKASIKVTVTQDVLVKKIVLDRTKLTVCETEEEDITDNLLIMQMLGML